MVAILYDDRGLRLKREVAFEHFFMFRSTIMHKKLMHDWYNALAGEKSKTEQTPIEVLEDVPKNKIWSGLMAHLTRPNWLFTSEIPFHHMQSRRYLVEFGGPRRSIHAA